MHRAGDGQADWQDRSVGKGSIAYADGHLYCRGESGTVSLVVLLAYTVKE